MQATAIHLDVGAKLASKSRPAFLLLFAALSGVAALGHQIVWTRALVDVAGASSATFSKVIGVFFLGLSSGAWFASHWPRHPNPWKRLAATEGLIALLSLPILFSAPLGGQIVSPLARVVILQWALPFAWIFFPSFAMGCSLPALIAVSGTRLLIPIYAVNTLGGVVGVFLAIFLIFPELGLQNTGLTFCALNAALAGIVWLLKPSAEGPASAKESDHTSVEWKWRIAAFISGFCVLGLEVLVQHQLAQVIINSMFSSAAVLIIVLVTLGLGGIVAAALRKSHKNTVLAVCLVAAALCAVEPFVFTWAKKGLAVFSYELPPMTYGMEAMKFSAITLAPMFLAAGLVFPFTLACAGRDVKAVGKLLAINGAGGWLGTVAFDHLLGPLWGLWLPVLAAVVLYGLLAVILATTLKSRIALSIAAAPLLFVLAWFGTALPQASLHPGEKLHALKVSPEGVVATVESAPDDWRILFNNSYTLGGSRAQFNQERQALLPLLLHAAPQSVGVLGIATGSTTAGATLLSEVQRIEAIELSPAVLDQAKSFFPPYNRRAFEDARVVVEVEDARWIVSCRTATYDVVIGDLFLPWRTGEGRLYSLEHFQEVRKSLKPGGLFCQWLPLFQLTEAQFQMILTTFTRVFPETLLVRGDFYSDLPIIGLVGNADLEELNWQGIRERCERLRLAGQVKDPLLRHAEGVAMLLLGPAPKPIPTSGLNTLANAALELDAGRNIIGLRTLWFVGVAQAQFFQNIHRAGQTLITPGLRTAHDAGQYVLTMEVAARSRTSFTENLKQQFEERIPEELLKDTSADWTQWPASIKPHRSPMTKAMATR